MYAISVCDVYIYSNRIESNNYFSRRAHLYNVHQSSLRHIQFWSVGDRDPWRANHQNATAADHRDWSGYCCCPLAKKKKTVVTLHPSTKHRSGASSHARLRLNTVERPALQRPIGEGTRDFNCPVTLAGGGLAPSLGPFHGAIAVPSVTRCRCRRRRRCRWRRGHRCAGGARQYR